MQTNSSLTPSRAALRMLAIGCGLALIACGASSVQRGAEFYDERRYIDAAQIFEHTERRLPEYDANERALYAVYRGATLLALGNREGARRWLDYGVRLNELLPERERRLLDHSLRAVADDSRPHPVLVQSAASSRVQGTAP